MKKNINKFDYIKIKVFYKTMNTIKRKISDERRYLHFK